MGRKMYSACMLFCICNSHTPRLTPLWPFKSREMCLAEPRFLFCYFSGFPTFSQEVFPLKLHTIPQGGQGQYLYLNQSAWPTAIGSCCPYVMLSRNGFDLQGATCNPETQLNAVSGIISQVQFNAKVALIIANVAK